MLQGTKGMIGMRGVMKGGMRDRMPGVMKDMSSGVIRDMIGVMSAGMHPRPILISNGMTGLFPERAGQGDETARGGLMQHWLMRCLYG